MKFLILGLLLLVPIGTVCGESFVSPYRDSDPKTFEGVVVSAKAGMLEMTDSGGKSHSLKITDATKITVNGRPGKLEDLQLSAKIRVILDDTNQVVAVSTVDKVKHVFANF